MFQKVKGIVLHPIKHGDSGLISHIYTESYGRQSFVIYGVRKRKTKANVYLFHPLSLLEIEIDFKENRNLQRIIEAKSTHIFNNIYIDIRRSTIAQFIGEILYKNIKESEPNYRLFDFLFNSVQLLDLTSEGVENFHLIFLLHLSKFLGFFPNDEIRDKFKGDGEISLLNVSLSELGSINISNRSRQEILNEILKFYEEQMTGVGNVKSLKILRELFH
jgi:DNA repair protein RecO (recombination protein O)